MRTNVIEQGAELEKILKSIVVHRRLVIALARRELTDMHAGQSGGILWIIVHPILMLLVYAFLFTIVLKVRIGDRGAADYIVYLFSGLAPWLLTQDAMVRSASVMVANTSIVKKVMFPIEVLVAKTVLASLVAQAILLAAVCVIALLDRGAPLWTFALLPVLVAMHVALLLGLALLLASITPYFRDIPELLRVFLTVNTFLIPVMYLPNWVPKQLQFLLLGNPFSHLIWCYQDVIYFGAVEHPWSWLIMTSFAGVTLVAGAAVFVRLRHHMSSVL